MSTNSTDPSQLFKNTTWKQLKDRFLLGVGDTYNTVNETGGESEHTLTVEEMPKHYHGLPQTASVRAYNNGNMSEWAFIFDNTYPQATHETGANQSHNNMPPYLTVYMWERLT